MKKLILPIFLFVLPLLNAQTGSELQNENIARAFVDGFSVDTYQNLPTLFAEQCEYMEIPSGRTFTTPSSILGYVEATLSGMPDCHTRLISVVANENMAVAEWIMEGTNTRGWPNIPATGNPFSLKILSIMEIEDGLIVKNRDYWDWATFWNAVND